MTYDPMRHHRHSIRYPGFDYASANAYFVTVCSQDRACLFGDVVDGEIVPSIAGAMVESWWHTIPRRFPVVIIDAFVVMPNHIHGIVMIGAAVDDSADRGEEPGGHGDPPLRMAHPQVGADLRVCPAAAQDVPTSKPSLPTIIQWFKSITTHDYAHGVQHQGLPPFRNRLWQRSFHDRIIRGDAELARIRQYIHDNPAAWNHDRENPAYMPPLASAITSPSAYSPRYEEHSDHVRRYPDGG